MKTPADLLEWRVSRRTFLLSHLILLIGFFIWKPLLVVVGNIARWILDILNLSPSESIQTIFVILFGIIFVALFLIVTFMQLSLTIRRLHDFNKSWWYYLSVLIPYVWALFLLIYCLLMKWTAGENKYGKIAKRPFLKDLFNI